MNVEYFFLRGFNRYWSTKIPAVKTLEFWQSYHRLPSSLLYLLTNTEYFVLGDIIELLTKLWAVRLAWVNRIHDDSDLSADPVFMKAQTKYLSKYKRAACLLASFLLLPAPVSVNLPWKELLTIKIFKGQVKPYCTKCTKLLYCT